MALIVEDGSVVTGANSYLTLAELREWATSRGVVFPTDDAELEVLALKAIDYLESLYSKYKGSMVEPGVQPLQWPRSDVNLYGVYLPSNEIPVAVKRAQYEAAAASLQGDIFSAPTLAVKKTKVDVIETEFFEPTTSSTGVDLTKAEVSLAPVLKSNFSVGVVRV